MVAKQVRLREAAVVSAFARERRLPDADLVDRNVWSILVAMMAALELCRGDVGDFDDGW